MYRILGIIISILLFLAPLMELSVHAQTMSNDTFKLQQGGINTFSGKSENSTFKAETTGGSLAPGIYKGDNYIVRTGFYYLNQDASSSASIGGPQASSFAFTISNTSLNFGQIKAGEPITRTNTLTIDTGSTSGYQVIASENHPIRTGENSAEIPDTTCDEGNCSETTSALWDSPLSYGFGYRCDNLEGSDCEPGFEEKTFFKQFANTQASETPQAIMRGTSINSTSQIEVTYKVNIAANQKAGVYQNTIEYIAIPTL